MFNLILFQHEHVHILSVTSVISGKRTLYNLNMIRSHFFFFFKQSLEHFFFCFSWQKWANGDLRVSGPGSTVHCYRKFDFHFSPPDGATTSLSRVTSAMVLTGFPLRRVIPLRKLTCRAQGWTRVLNYECTQNRLEANLWKLKSKQGCVYIYFHALHRGHPLKTFYRELGFGKKVSGINKDVTQIAVK